MLFRSPLRLAAIPPPATSFRQLFHDHYPALRGLLDGREAPGLAMLLASPRGVEASGWVPAGDAAVNPLILGRHSSADLLLPADLRVSLRQLALVVHRRRGSGAVPFRVLDLRTSLAFTDENASRLEALEASGPVFLWCGSLGLFLFPTGGGSAAWPRGASEAWSSIPERRFVAATPVSSRRGPAPGHECRRVAAAAADPDLGSTTLVNTFAGPAFPSFEPDESDAPHGELLVASASGRVALRLGGLALSRGVLLGRYDRCDTAGLPILIDPALSRVHLLVLEIDGGLYGIDTASKNGSWVGEGRVQVAPLRPGLRVSLAGKATVEWRAFH
jgi:hypothetical protein